MLFRRYSADLTPLLKYIVHQLHNGQTTEIIVLRELIWKMAGIEPLPSLSDSQIISMAGGPCLRIEAIASSTRGARLDPGDAVLKGPQRLGRVLLESSLALPLLVQVAQQRESCVFKAPDAHLTTLASLYDSVRFRCRCRELRLTSSHSDARRIVPVSRASHLPERRLAARLCKQSSASPCGTGRVVRHLCSYMYAHYSSGSEREAARGFLRSIHILKR